MPNIQKSIYGIFCIYMHFPLCWSIKNSVCLNKCPKYLMNRSLWTSARACYLLWSGRAGLVAAAESRIGLRQEDGACALHAAARQEPSSRSTVWGPGIGRGSRRRVQRCLSLHLRMSAYPSCPPWHSHKHRLRLGACRAESANSLAAVGWWPRVSHWTRISGRRHHPSVPSSWMVPAPGMAAAQAAHQPLNSSGAADGPVPGSK